MVADGFNRWYKRSKSRLEGMIRILYQRLKPSATMQIVPMGLTVN
jgi:hypothetical protein